MSLYVPTHFDARDRVAIARLAARPPVRDAGDARRRRAARLAPAAPAASPTASRTARCSAISRAPIRMSTRRRGVESIAIFHGPHAYVSPSWYAEPAAAVPTWNYAVVHAHGTLELAREPRETRAILDSLIQRFESGRAAPWQLGTRPRRGWRRWSARSSASACGSSASTPSSSCRRTARPTTARASPRRSTAEGYAEADGDRRVDARLYRSRRSRWRDV